MPGTKGVMPDMSDPLQVAVKVMSVEGALALLTQQVSQGLGNVQSQLSALQGDVRSTSDKVNELAATQHEIQSHSQGLDRLARAIETFTAENIAWRRAHEAENRGVSDAVTSAKGALKLIAWSGVFIIGLVVFTVQMQFNSGDMDRRRIEVAHALDIKRTETMIVEGLSRADRRIDRADAEREELKRMKDLK